MNTENLKMSEVKVSFFDNIKQTIPTKTVTLFDAVTSTEFKEQVEAIRSPETPEAEKKRLKERLPYFTPSGTFSKRNENGLIEHSRFICVDIDEKENTHLGNFNELKDLISAIRYVAYCGYSAGGKGFFVLIPIQDPSRHKGHFQSLQKAFERCGVVIDKMCSDVSRPRYVSYDHAPYFNHNAKTYDRFVKQQERRKPQTTQATDALFNEVKTWAEHAEKYEMDITEGYDVWVALSYCLANMFGENGRELFHIFSSVSPQYNHSDCDKQFTYTLGSSKADRKGYGLTKLRELCQHLIIGVDFDGLDFE